MIPGSSFEYSNTNYLLLGQVIEAIEQKPFNQVLSDRLFTPFQLNNSYLDQYDPYTQTKVGAWFTQGGYDGTDYVSFMSSAWAAGGVVATPNDLAMWAYRLYRGDVLSAGSLDKMRTGTPLQGGATYGLGVIESTIDGKTYLGHGGTTLQNSEMQYSLSSDFSVVVMNMDYGFYSQTTTLEEELIKLVDALMVQVSTEEINTKQLEVKLYPNPSSSQMTLDVGFESAGKPVSIEVLDLTGRLVYQQQSVSGTAILDKENIGSGIFVANVLSDNVLIGSKKIVFH